MARGKRTKPRCEIEFHTPLNFYALQGTFDPSDDMLSVVTSKSLDSTAGTFSITLTHRNLGTRLNPETWYDRINPMDLVVMKMGRPPEALDTPMVGIVDEVRRTRQISEDGSPERRVVIKGRDFGKVFLKAMLEFFPQLDDNTLPLEMLDGADTLLALKEFFISEDFEYGSTAELIYRGITKILYNLMSFEATIYDPNTKQPTISTLKEILRFRLCRTNATLPFVNTLAEYEGSFWNFISSSLNKPFFELFVDTRSADELMRMVPNPITEFESFGIGRFEQTWGEDNAKVCLILRPTPFDTGNWDSLDTHEIPDEDIISEDLGRSDHENQNMWRVRPVVNLVGNNVYDRDVKPELNAENIKRYGISFFQTDLQGLSADEDSNEWSTVVRFGQALSQKLKAWYWRNIWFENGTITIQGNGKIRIGQRVRIPEEYHNHIYYVEAVSQSFVNKHTWTTTLTLTRGQDYVGPSGVDSVTIPTEIKSYTTEELTAVSTSTDITESSSAEPQYYVVKSGDTLSSICTKFYQSVSRELIDGIVQANPQIKDPAKIYPGQKFKIPAL